jgi:hypothetical protein
VTPRCDAPTATCVGDIKPNGVACDQDANVCTGVGTCANAVCKPTPGTALNCNDDNPCTGPDTCNPVTGCSNPNRPDGPGVAGCDDGLFCTGEEKCESGECMSGALPCAPPLVCNPNTESCQAAPQCMNPNECPDDGNPCTDRACNGGVCSNVPR